jgi:hypothetical protein
MTNKGGKKKNETNHQQSTISHRLTMNQPATYAIRDYLCKTNTQTVQILPTSFPKKNTKYYEILQNNTKIHSQKGYISHHFFQSFRFFFYYFYPLFCTFCPFFQVLDQKVLNYMYNKDLHNFFTPAHMDSSSHLLIIPFTLSCKTNPIQSDEPREKSDEYMQNEPNFTKASSVGLNRRATRDGPRATKLPLHLL